MNEVDLRGAILIGTSALGLRLWESNLQVASFNRADLMGASFHVADTASFRGADFTQARLWHSSIAFTELGSFAHPDLPIRAKDLQLNFELPFEARLNSFGQQSSSDYDKIIAWSTSTVSNQKTREDIVSNMSLLKSDAMTKLPGNPKADDVFSDFLRPWLKAQQVELSADALRGYQFEVYRTIACRSNKSSTNDKVPDQWSGTPLEDWAGLDVWSGSGRGWTSGHDDSYFGSPHVAEALIENGLVASLGTRAQELARLLADPTACPGADKITAAAKADLTALIAARQSP
jgi:hypothetical protein